MGPVDATYPCSTTVYTVTLSTTYEIVGDSDKRGDSARAALQLSDVLGRAMYAGERIGVTRNGRLTAVVAGVADLEALEEFEMPRTWPPSVRPRPTTTACASP